MLIKLLSFKKKEDPRSHLLPTGHRRKFFWEEIRDLLKQKQ